MCSDSDYDDPTVEDKATGDADLAAVELACDAKITDHVDAHVLLKYEVNDVFVDEGFITLSGSDTFPAFLFAGRHYIPFGNFDSHVVTDPNTFVLGETEDDAKQTDTRTAQLAVEYYSINRAPNSLSNLGGKIMRSLRLILSATVFAALMLSAGLAGAHFGAIIPSDDILTQDDSKTLELQIKFIHPMEMHYMEMAKPKQFGVMQNGRKTDLLKNLAAAKGKAPDQKEMHSFWKASYSIRRPGDYTFFVEPTPYWEPAEDLFIVHYTKVCVNALGLEKGWDEPVGLETEIIPLARPYGLWTGNLFTGRVLLKGKPVPGAEVEIEYLNESRENEKIVVAPADAFVTQVVKADANGVFSYAMPKSGWWGFAALSEAGWKLKKDGQEKIVEIGAVFWVHTREMH